MSEQNNPWSTDGMDIIDCNGDYIFTVDELIEGPERARRIVACVNACVGIDNDTLEAGAIVKSDKLFIITKEHFAACDMLEKLAKEAREVIEDNDSIGSFDASKLCDLIIKAEELLRG